MTQTLDRPVLDDDVSDLSQQGDLAAVEAVDPTVADLMRQEARRQVTTLEMIASENHVSARGA